MRQERIVKKPRRRTTRQVEVAPLKLAATGPDVADAEALLDAIDAVLAVAS